MKRQSNPIAHHFAVSSLSFHVCDVKDVRDKMISRSSDFPPPPPPKKKKSLTQAYFRHFHTFLLGRNHIYRTWLHDCQCGRCSNEEKVARCTSVLWLCQSRILAEVALQTWLSSPMYSSVDDTSKCGDSRATIFATTSAYWEVPLFPRRRWVDGAWQNWIFCVQG